MKHWLLTISLAAIALPLSQVAHVSDAEAQSRGVERSKRAAAERGNRDGSSQAEEENLFPNATRTERKPEMSQRIYPQIIKAHERLNEGDNDRAKQDFEKFLTNDRLTGYERAVVYQGLAQLAYENDDAESAIGYWRKALETDALPNRTHFQLLYQVAQMHMMEEQYTQALGVLDEWIQLTGSRTAESLALRGNALYRLERYPEAIQALDQAIAASESPEASWLEMKMAAYYDQENYTGAAEALIELSRLQPNEVKHQINLSQLYIELEQNDKALEVLAKLRQENRLTTHEHWRQLYQLLAYADKPADAAAAIEAGLQSGVLKEDAQVLRSLGDNYYVSEQIPKAIEAYGRSAALSTDGVADQQRGHLLVDQERYAEAKEALTTAFRKGGLTDEGTAWLLLGEAENETGNRAAAKAAFEKASGFESSRENARIWLQNF